MFSHAAIERANELSRPTIVRILGEECPCRVRTDDEGTARGMFCTAGPLKTVHWSSLSSHQEGRFTAIVADRRREEE